MTAAELTKLLFKEAIPTASFLSGTQCKCKQSDPVKCMDTSEIIELLHAHGKSPPLVRPCDTPNPSDTKSSWTAEELHRITGCRPFQNYHHLLFASKDGSYIDHGKFPISIGAYTTIPKAPRGKAIDQTSSKYLDVVHLGITFGDCMSVGGFKYALIVVDRTTRFNWCFGFKSFSHDDIIVVHFGLKLVH